MHKRILHPVHSTAAPDDLNWLDIDRLADVEVTSEDPAHPIESALLFNRTSGWRAGEPGQQTIRLLFASPQQLRRIRVRFMESVLERTQEYVLRWSHDGGDTFRDIVRQQWNFSPQGATSEIEDHHVELPHVTILELCILPDIGNNRATASLEQMRVA